MPWNQEGGGGPWGGGGGGGNRGGGPWGRQPGPQPPDLEELLRRSQDKVKRFVPGGPGMSKTVLPVLMALGLMAWFATGFYKVEPDQVGVELVFGRFDPGTGVTQPGLRWNFPTPIGQVYKPQVTRVNQEEVGFRATGNRRGGELIQNVSDESLMLTGDENIIDIQFVTFWRINDASKYLFHIRNPGPTVKDASESAMREIIGKSDFEYIRTKGRAHVEQEARDLIQQILNSYGSGIEVTEVNLQKIDPPGKVLDAFRDVQAARADKERVINEATAYHNERVQKAEGEAEKILAEAEGYKQQVIAIANGKAQRFLSVLKQYEADPEVTRRRMYLETMKGIMERMDKVLIENKAGGTGVVPYLPLNQAGKPIGQEQKR